MSRPVVVTTDEAASAVDVEPVRFREWARRRGLERLRLVRVGRASVALYDLDEVYEAANRLGPRVAGRASTAVRG